MKTIRSDVIGYCFGVSKTIQDAQACLEKAKAKGVACYSIGSLIHNKFVVDSFVKQGMTTIEEASDAQPGIALVRAHGIPESQKRDFLEKGFEVVDSTCPIVAKGSEALRNAAKKGKALVIIGFRGHAEVVGLQGVEVQEGKRIEAHLISSLEEAKAFVASGLVGIDQAITVVTQTTFGQEDFNAIRDCLKSHFTNITFPTQPCGATSQRIKAVKKLASIVDAVVVVGGKNSANTKGLANVAQNQGKRAFLIESVADIDENMRGELAKYNCVGLCSGSSTPSAMIDPIEELLESL